MSRKINLLLVENNPGDADLVAEMLRSNQSSCGLFHVSNGVEAMAFLRKEGDYNQSPSPDLILMDLSMPQMSGAEVLREIKTDASLRMIPVIIMSSSRSNHDVEELYSLQASAYIEKPIDLERFKQIICAIDAFWIQVVRYSLRGGNE